MLNKDEGNTRKVFADNGKTLKELKKITTEDKLTGTDYECN